MKVEEIAIQIGELVTTEIEDVNRIDYIKNDNGELTAFVVVMENGKQFVVDIKAK